MDRKENFDAHGTQVSMKQLPKTCRTCPFYFEPRPENHGTWYEDWDCFLVHIEDCTGIFLRRYSKCPLVRK